MSGDAPGERCFASYCESTNSDVCLETAYGHEHVDGQAWIAERRAY